MNYQKTIIISVLAGLLIFTAVCTDANSAATPDIAGTAAAMAETVVVEQLTLIAEQNPSPTPEDTEEPEPTVTLTLPPLPPEVTLAATVASDDEEERCLSARLSSETIPDNTVLASGERFEKTWVITNTGTCAWTGDFKVVFHHGELMGAVDRFPFPGYVAPGQSIPISVFMNAPRDPGDHVSFWIFESPSGETFGAGAGGGVPVWVKVVVPGPTGLPQAKQYSAQSYGQVRSDGWVENEAVAGDSAQNLTWQGFFTFNFQGVPENATITSVTLDLAQGYKVTGDPFGELGCLNVYQFSYGALDAGDYTGGAPGATLWTFCGENELALGSYRAGGSAAVSAYQAATPAGQIQLSMLFQTDTNSNGTPDNVRVYPYMRIEYIVP